MTVASRTYYDVLGVSPETPAVVVKAAFRALAKEYHPDSSAEAAADPDRFIELQDAYAVLSDPAARSAYDTALQEAADAERQGSAEVSPDSGEGAVPVPLAPDGPALQAVHARFMLYSEELAAGFREAVRAGRSEDELLAFAERIEEQFLKEYFGDDQDIRALAKLLLLRCRKDAVLELNALVGTSVGFPPAARRRSLAEFIERHFAGEGLLLPWLREKFAGSPPPPAALAAEPERRQERLATSRKPTRPQTVRSMVKVLCWSCAVYFGVLVVSALTH